MLTINLTTATAKVNVTKRPDVYNLCWREGPSFVWQHSSLPICIRKVLEVQPLETDLSCRIIGISQKLKRKGTKYLTVKLPLGRVHQTVAGVGCRCVRECVMWACADSAKHLGTIIPCYKCYLYKYKRRSRWILIGWEEMHEYPNTLARLHQKEPSKVWKMVDETQRTPQGGFTKNAIFTCHVQEVSFFWPNFLPLLQYPQHRHELVCSAPNKPQECSNACIHWWWGGFKASAFKTPMQYAVTLHY